MGVWELVPRPLGEVPSSPNPLLPSPLPLFPYVLVPPNDFWFLHFLCHAPTVFLLPTFSILVLNVVFLFCHPVLVVVPCAFPSPLLRSSTLLYPPFIVSDTIDGSNVPCHTGPPPCPLRTGLLHSPHACLGSPQVAFPPFSETSAEVPGLSVWGTQQLRVGRCSEKRRSSGVSARKHGCKMVGGDRQGNTAEPSVEEACQAWKRGKRTTTRQQHNH